MADDLRRWFSVHGSFYYLINGNERLLSRNKLEIRDLRAEVHPGKPDAVVIMMNPGSSHLIDPNIVIPEVHPNDADELVRLTLLPTKPDNAQYQIMRLMLLRTWTYVRVINLSDWKIADSSTFLSGYSSIRTNVHTIFHEVRQNELNRALDVDEVAPLICAWGQDLRILPLANMCFENQRQIVHT